MDIRIQVNKKNVYMVHLQELEDTLKKFFKKNLITFPIKRVRIKQSVGSFKQLKIIIEIDPIVASEYFYNKIVKSLFKKFQVDFMCISRARNKSRFPFSYYFYSEFEIFDFYASIQVDVLYS